MYNPNDKQVYVFPGGDRKGDPLELRRKLTLLSGGKLSEWIDAFNDGEGEVIRAQAEDDLVRVSRSAFGLTAVAEKGGVCDAVVLEYLAHFLEWLLRPSAPTVKAFPTPCPCTDCPPPRTT